MNRRARPGTDAPDPPDRSSAAPSSPSASLTAPIAAHTLGRFVTNIAIRFVYSFLPVLARGLGTSVGTLGIVLSARDLTGLTSPLVGRHVDRGHTRGWLLGALGATAVASLVCTVGGLWGFAIGQLVIGAAAATFVVANTTWIGHRVPFRQRGRAIAVVELSWAVALLAGVPVLGLLIDGWGPVAGWGWRSPFLAVALASVAAMVVVARVLPVESPPAPQPGAPSAPATDGAGPPPERPERTWPLVGGVALMAFGMQQAMVIHAAWLEDEIGLSVAGLGVVAFVLGGFELVGSGANALASDRIGKRRSALAGIFPLIVVLAVLPLLPTIPWMAVAALGCGVLLFEFSFVATLPLLTELDPAAPARALGRALAVMTVARAIGTVVATTAYELSGITGPAVIGAFMTALAAACFVAGVREPAS
ncbi:MAG: MFS transporter [Actinomycetota bacterium]|nr:MFS transporter [Actinomycetota bacterium]